MNKNRLRSTLLKGIGLLLIASFVGCTTERSRSIESQQTRAATTANAYRGPKAPISVGKFSNSSDFMRGIFSDGLDRVGEQARALLVGHLQRTGRFSVLNRSNLEELEQEAGFNKQATEIKGARYVVTGEITGLGRRTQGDRQLWGIVSKGKKQVAYSSVILNVVDTHTSEVVYSVSGTGETILASRGVALEAFSANAGYDQTLTKKVLELAVREAVDGLINGIEIGDWQP